MFFIQQVRPQVVAELGEDGKRVAAVTKAVGERWSKMSAEEKAVRTKRTSKYEHQAFLVPIFQIFIRICELTLTSLLVDFDALALRANGRGG
jgi:hypothetical protein